MLPLPWLKKQTDIDNKEEALSVSWYTVSAFVLLTGACVISPPSELPRNFMVAGVLCGLFAIAKGLDGIAKAIREGRKRSLDE